MNTYRFVYWFGSCTTEWYVRANTEEEAIQKFKSSMGGKEIVHIEKCIY